MIQEFSSIGVSLQVDFKLLPFGHTAPDFATTLSERYCRWAKNILEEEGNGKEQ
jgi:hypothetical protein